jgi:hypothetical protein
MLSSLAGQYNWSRAKGRLLLAFFFGCCFILLAHDILPPLHLPPPCNGGLKEALEFLIQLLIAAGIIEASSWILWQSTRKIQGGGIANNWSIDGSKLVFAPADSSLALILGVALMVAGTFLHLLPSPCDAAIFSWREAEYFVLAYAFLAFDCALPRSRRR